ncbi:hypothetical protein [Tengunoibacter tsumagoiensis]|uniref:Uncharacterized protein n=1 Tax=Tengunoibacter tsumagoiensis TaxID=2014871 RepID=A0A402A553_9CHLR|nr:hypothetical protein [Tengunoibacter tsumagoiensis]GCE14186.1 hypothetical protein KTT_40450 [Tengunoibacter tsumagoiensis]GCE14240.1 hypothetical protein KTT_40990 [Tengunoibacter tsumagoiensis]
MAEQNSKLFDDLFADAIKQIKASIDETKERIALQASCRMRRFYLIGDDGRSNIAAVGIVFSDGAVMLRWEKKIEGEAWFGECSFYDSVERLDIVCGKSFSVKYIDAEVKQ